MEESLLSICVLSQRHSWLNNMSKVSGVGLCCVVRFCYEKKTVSIAVVRNWGNNTMLVGWRILVEVWSIKWVMVNRCWSDRHITNSGGWVVMVHIVPGAPSYNQLYIYGLFSWGWEIEMKNQRTSYGWRTMIM